MNRIRVSKPLLAITVALGLLLGACGGNDSTSSAIDTGGTNSPAEETGSPSPTETTSPTPTNEGGVSAYEVWFNMGERLAPTFYERPATPRIGAAALEDLFAGPRQGNLHTSIPQGTELLDLSIEDGLATANLSAEFETTGGSYAERNRLAQVVFTLTQFPTVEGVVFEIEGKRVKWFGGHGLGIDDPQRRSHFEDLAPAIIVDLPRSGATVTSPIVISGTANVFEATVSIRILDSTGAVLKETFTTATCGTGCRGDYEVKVSFEIDEAQKGTVMVFESSAENGRPINVVKVPVTLLP